MYEINEGKSEERDDATQHYHRDVNDNSRVTQFLVTAETFFLRVPRPRTFLQLDFYFAEKVFDFGNHLKVPKKRPTSNAQRPISLQLRSMFSSMFQGSAFAARSTRQEGLEPPTDGFGDRYSTN